jgi:YtxH-like protein
MEFGKDFTRNFPSSEEIIRALGLHSRRDTASELVPSLALFGAGLLVGAGLALLFAPSSGRELREEIGERAADLRDKVAGADEEAAGGDGHRHPVPR